MQGAVYRVLQRGVRLPRPQAPVSGDLVLAPYTDHSGRPALRARLLQPRDPERRSLIPDLHGATVTRITANGLAIAGYEVVPRRTNNKSGADHFAQRWWTLIFTMQLADSLDLATLDEHFRVVPGTGRGEG